MPTLPDFDPIAYLLRRKDRTYPKRLSQATEVYRRHLLTLSRNEIKELVLQEQKKQEEERERQLFFNLPEADADVAHWAKMAKWTVDEAIALSLGKEPSRVDWKRVAPWRQHPFAERYLKLRDIVRRGVLVGELPELISPGSYILWALENDVELPTRLVDAVNAHNQVALDWKSLKEDFVNSHQQYTQSLETIGVLEATLAETQVENQRLQEELAAIRAEDEAGYAETRPLATRERESLESILLVGAIRGYGFDPAKRNNASSRIAGDLALLGLELSDDTVRTHLKRAAESLRPDWRTRLSCLSNASKTNEDAND